MESAEPLYLHLPKNQIWLRQTWINGEQGAIAIMLYLTQQQIMPLPSSHCTLINNKCNLTSIISRSNSSNKWFKLVLLGLLRPSEMGIMETWVPNRISLKPHKRLTLFIKIRSGKPEGVTPAIMSLAIISQRQICRLEQRNSPLVSTQWLENLALLRG